MISYTVLITCKQIGIIMQIRYRLAMTNLCEMHDVFLCYTRRDITRQTSRAMYLSELNKACSTTLL